MVVYKGREDKLGERRDVSGVLQVRESGSGSKGSGHSGFSGLVLPQGLAAHLGDGWAFLLPGPNVVTQCLTSC